MASQTRNASTRRTEPESEPELIGVFATLAAEHREAAALLAALLAEPRDVPTLWPLTRAALVSHEQGEVRELFPVLRADAGLRGLADLHDTEARLLDQLIYQLDTLPMTSPAWIQVLTRLAATVAEHVAEEETEIFPAAQQALGEARSVQIDVDYRATKAKLVDAHWAPPREPQGMMQTARSRESSSLEPLPTTRQPVRGKSPT